MNNCQYAKFFWECSNFGYLANIWNIHKFHITIEFCKYQCLGFSKKSNQNYPKSLTKSTKNTTCIHPLPLGSWIPFISVSSTPTLGSKISALWSRFSDDRIGIFIRQSSDAGFWAQIVLVTLQRRRWGRCIDVLVKIQFCY